MKTFFYNTEFYQKKKKESPSTHEVQITKIKKPQTRTTEIPNDL